MARTNMVRNGDCGQRTKELIARYYLTLMGEYRNDTGVLYLSMDMNDMFHNAITLILQDSSFQRLNTDDEIMAKIRKRISAVISEIMKDSILMNNKKEDKHAYDLQTEEEQAE